MTSLWDFAICTTADVWGRIPFLNLHLTSPELGKKGGNSPQVEAVRAAVQLGLSEIEETYAKTSLVVISFFFFSQRSILEVYSCQ